MISLLRNFGFGLMILGGLLVIVWAIEPFREIWPWLLTLPLIIRVGVIIAAVGLAVILASMITERIRERDADRTLREDL